MASNTPEPVPMFFNPDPEQYHESTLKTFEEFIAGFQSRYNAQYTTPSKTSIDPEIKCI